MAQRVLQRVNHALERRFPEQRLFLKSDTETRFIRLRPLTQAIATVVGGALVAWTILATAILMIDYLSAGNAREQAQRSVVEFERRLDALSRERDERAAEAVRAQERFNQALAKVSQMQSLLLASEDRRKEVETGLDVVQLTLRRTIRERDQARGEVAELKGELIAKGGEGSLEAARARETEATVDLLAATLGATAVERDTMAESAAAARAEARAVAEAKRKIEKRNDEIFRKLEDAVTVSMEPLDRMFRAAGLKPDEVLRQVRRGYSGQGGPLGPMRISTKGIDPSADELRANTVLNGLDRMALYRLAAARLPFAVPVKSGFRFTSGFGYRRDPKGAGTRMHAGTDFAAGRGTPIYTTGDGVVIKAGWHSGYGKAVIVRHDFGIETLYAHMSEIRVKEGQRVSRGDRIGDMGSTGRSTGTHLHYEVRVGGKPVNPMIYIKAASNVF
ncbi:M23 family metallopeptidase [Gemmobacter nectariphilus]|uniref:M23 family metallopeptidase n=1 Tax=Gemmobacter nectariphilus TaxID=220343 RepID=UPI000419458F|nr:M23 family metallopeptidase [Gemmobacter nectariphilus]